LASCGVPGGVRSELFKQAIEKRSLTRHDLGTPFYWLWESGVAADADGDYDAIHRRSTNATEAIAYSEEYHIEAVLSVSRMPASPTQLTFARFQWQ